ncbi:Flp pilus assembly complex ATPase component TadA [Verrucomicrobiaceae bacterium 5K15]|uniref:Flp pilus assembly complex ATPase component TadA n=1 Tax=Oceaniferula flava TaxID=2800421 RepID=A0AAE2V7U8_9BACT|nr:ATPase, T2SS/T4P/T4SS family [Oceaniferula flavus]MBK1854442.1 Flp pilus assembly complex ATPase component TadA [Oceaniferula flavus]MBM1135748.1 Flp pilus assembly complex ATPase component TadA [Oceaniferula flavus]
MTVQAADATATAPTSFRQGMTGAGLLGVIFQVCDSMGVSDIQIRSELPVYIETHKGMECLAHLGVLSSDDVYKIYRELLNNRESASHGFGETEPAADRAERKIEEALGSFKETRVDDFSCNGIFVVATGKTSGRLRIQVHLSANGLGVTCRILNDSIPELSSLGIDQDTAEMLRLAVQRRAGLCLVTGPTGSGKSTTLAAIIDWLRRNHPKHIVTVEDPVEYQYPKDMDDPHVPGQKIMAPSIVTQQEVGRDLASYRQGLKDVLRKAPHVILLGEIRDREAMETCMEAAQTGHLVLSTLHTTGAVKTMGRILEMYPRENHPAVLNRLSEILIFIHSQGLLSGINGRVLTYEFLQNNEDAVSSAIGSYDRGARALEDVIKRAGNIAWDEKLTSLYEEGKISKETFENARMHREDVNYV